MPYLAGPVASVFHSGASASSAATKVGSPPWVSRTSPATRSASTLSPTSSRAAQPSSSKGRVIRVGWATRVTVISKEKSVLAVLTMPLIGAQDR